MIRSRKFKGKRMLLDELLVQDEHIGARIAYRYQYLSRESNSFDFVYYCNASDTSSEHSARMGPFSMTKLSVGYQGAPGSHSESAVSSFFQDADARNFKTFAELLQAVKDQQIERALVPFEHSSVGTFFQVLDLIERLNLRIIGEYQTVEEHLLASVPGVKLEDLKEISSHPYVFDQCQAFLDTLPASVKVIQSSDTSISAAAIAASQDKTSAAIVSSSCAKLHNLQVLKSVADDQLAVTRYVVVSREGIVPERHTDPRTSIVVVLKNQAGALAKVTSAFAFRDINISKVESRPSARSIKVNALTRLEEHGNTLSTLMLMAASESPRCRMRLTILASLVR
jgi:prephenate dehydratase